MIIVKHTAHSILTNYPWDKNINIQSKVLKNNSEKESVYDYTLLHSQ